MKKNIIIIASGLGYSVAVSAAIKKILEENHGVAIHTHATAMEDLASRMSDASLSMKKWNEGLIMAKYPDLTESSHPDPSTRKYKAKNFGSHRK